MSYMKKKDAWLERPAFSANTGGPYAEPKIARGNQDPKIPLQTDRCIPLEPVSVSKRVSNFTK